MKAKNSEQTFNVNDKIRHMVNLSIFEKQAQSKCKVKFLTRFII